jgi:hypothetical protein
MRKFLLAPVDVSNRSAKLELNARMKKKVPKNAQRILMNGTFYTKEAINAKKGFCSIREDPS